MPAQGVSFHETRPVLIYFHGGGFFAGDKNWSEDVYSNIGYYFASQGIVTVSYDCVSVALAAPDMV